MNLRTIQPICIKYDPSMSLQSHRGLDPQKTLIESVAVSARFNNCFFQALGDRNVSQSLGNFELN